MKEEALLFGSASALVGVVTRPDEADAAGKDEAPAFVFLNAGVTHHVGPNRLYVRLARELAEDGFTSLRYDFSGLGDSAARTDDMTAWNAVIAETREAMDELESRHGIARFVLIGICSGATSSFITAQRDERVVGAVLINGQAHLHGQDLALTDHLREKTLAHHSWRIALRSSFRAKNVRKLLGGQLRPGRIAEMLFVSPAKVLFRQKGEEGEPVEVPDVLPELRGLTERGVRLYHLYCEGDEGLDYFQVLLGDRLREVETDANSRYEVIRGANHMFTLGWTQDLLAERVRTWARELPGAPERPEPVS